MINILHKSKSEVRVETADAVALFLARGGSIQVVKSRKTPKQTMRGKTSRGFAAGTSGFANGFPKKSIAG